MENTSALLFDNSQQKYFLASGESALGPLTTQELYDRLSRGQCHFLNFVWCEGWKEWRSISSIEDFKDLLPRKPDKTSFERIQKILEEKRRKVLSEIDRTKPIDDKVWYLHNGEAQFGPFSEAELQHSIDVQNISQGAHVWRSGWAQWKKLDEVPELKAMLKPELPPSPPLIPGMENEKRKKDKNKENEEKRKSPRKPLVARLFLHNDAEVVVAVCRDISVGGMQVLTDHIPGDVGSIVKLNVSPGDTRSVKGFVAEGEIVRILEDGRGFSFRFTKLSMDAKRAIQGYVKHD